MADAALEMTENGGDIVLEGLDLARDDGLETAVLISLFTDRRATPEQLPAGLSADDLRGYWGDVGKSDETGSHLWLLSREKQIPQTLARAQQYCRDALAWLLDDRIATRVEVGASYVATGWMQIDVAIDGPDGLIQYRYNYEWAAQAAKRAA